MAWKTLISILFLPCLLGTSSAEASPFGALYSWHETPDFAPRGLTTTPDVAKWLMTLPRSHNWPSVVAPDKSAQVSDAKPIRSEGDRLLAVNIEVFGTKRRSRSLARSFRC